MFFYMYNIALILFLKCDVTKFRIPPPLSYNVTLRRPSPPLTCDVIYGWPLSLIWLACSLHISVNERLLGNTRVGIVRKRCHVQMFARVFVCQHTLLICLTFAWIHEHTVNRLGESLTSVIPRYNYLLLTTFVNKLWEVLPHWSAYFFKLISLRQIHMIQQHLLKLHNHYNKINELALISLFKLSLSP